MNKKQIKTLLHYVTIAMEQSKAYKHAYNNYYDSYEKKTRKKPLSNEEIDSLEIVHCDLELKLKNINDLKLQLTNPTYKIIKEKRSTGLSVFIVVKGTTSYGTFDTRLEAKDKIKRLKGINP